jgi:hypothetical protein
MVYKCIICGIQLRADNSIGYCRKHRSKSPDRREWKKVYAIRNKEYISQKNKENYIKTRESKIAYQKEYYSKNSSLIYQRSKDYNKKLYKKRYDNDPLFKMSRLLRCRTSLCFSKFGVLKTKHTLELLGESYDFIMKYIESKFKKGMSWSNYGHKTWHIDHIIPLSTAKTVDELIKLCHYSNLQPMWAYDNLRKQGRIDYPDFEKPPVERMGFEIHLLKVNENYLNKNYEYNNIQFT